ncbi:MAG: glycosyltransferase [Cyclobacteriaceae bacterium]
MSLENIDILITTRNRIAELIFTIDHCLAIGCEEDQIWVMDDASEDGTSQSITKQYPKIHLLKNETSKGLIANRNTLMQATIKPYTLSLDDDSHIRTQEDILEAIDVLESNPYYGIFHFHAFEQLAEPPAKEYLPNTVREIRTYIGCGHIIKREVIQKLGKYREEFEFYCEELDYSIRAWQAGYKVVTQDNLVVHHRIDWETRGKQFQDDLSKGIYGAVNRSILGFSNNLIVVNLYFPFPFNLLFTVYYTLLRFKNFYLKKGDREGFRKGWARYRSFSDYIKENRKAMAYTIFQYWIKLKVK